MSKNLNMTQGNPLKLLIRFALPLMFGNVFQQLYTVVDTAIVGRGVGMTALAAIGSVDWLNWLLLGVAQGFTQGFSVRISQKFGQGDQKGLQLFMGQSAIASVVLAILCTGLGQAALPLFLRILRVPEELAGTSALYVRIIFAGLPVVFLFNYCSSMLRAVGDSKTPLIAMVAAALTNIVLDLVTVFVLRWGVAGAAGATVLAQCLSGVICLLKIRRTPQLQFTRQDTVPQRDVLTNLMKIGFPVASKNIMVALGGIVITTVVNTFGTAFIAGFTATNKLYGLLEIAAISYHYAVTTYVGQNYGAMRFDRIRSGMKNAAILAAATAAVIAVLMIVFGRSITMLFISGADGAQAVIAGNYAYRYLCIMAYCLPVLYMLYLFLAGLQGLGDTVRPMISGIVELVLRVCIAMLVAHTGYETGVFWAETAAWIGATVYLAYHFIKRMKKGLSQM